MLDTTAKKQRTTKTNGVFLKPSNKITNPLKM